VPKLARQSRKIAFQTRTPRFNQGMTMGHQTDAKRRGWIRGLIGSLALSLACQVAAKSWIVTSLGGNTARIQRPYNDLWYPLAENVPLAIC